MKFVGDIGFRFRAVVAVALNRFLFVVQRSDGQDFEVFCISLPDVAAHVEKGYDALGKVADRIGHDSEPAEVCTDFINGVPAGSVTVAGEVEYVYSGGVLECGETAHGKSAFTAEFIGRAEVVFRHGERFVLDAGRKAGCHVFIQNRRHSCIDVAAREAPCGAEGSGMREVVMVVHIIEFLARESVDGTICAGNVGRRLADSHSPQSGGHFPVDFNLMFVEETGVEFKSGAFRRRDSLSLAPCRKVFADVSVLNGIGVRVLELFVSGHHRVFVDETDCGQGGVVFQGKTCVRVDGSQHGAREIHEIVAHGFVEHHPGFDFEHAVEFFRKTLRAAGVKVNGRVNSAFFQRGDKIVQVVEAFRVNRTVGFRCIDEVGVEMMQTGRIESVRCHQICENVRFLMCVSGCDVVAEVAAVEADRNAGPVFKNEVLSFTFYKTVFSGRRVQQEGEVESASGDTAFSFNGHGEFLPVTRIHDNGNFNGFRIRFGEGNVFRPNTGDCCNHPDGIVGT